MSIPGPGDIAGTRAPDHFNVPDAPATVPRETVAGVAEKIGYSSPFAFSAAFKRVRGMSPQEYSSQGTA